VEGEHWKLEFCSKTALNDARTARQRHHVAPAADATKTLLNRVRDANDIDRDSGLLGSFDER
jgi:hypothetical protein